MDPLFGIMAGVKSSRLLRVVALCVRIDRTGYASYGAQAAVAAPEIAGEVVHPAPYMAQADAAAPVASVVAGASFRRELMSCFFMHED